MKTYRVIGLMSGTSMDGLDVADVIFNKSDKGNWIFHLAGSRVFDYEDTMVEKLQAAFQMSAPDLMEFSAQLGRFYGEKINQYLEENSINPSDIDLIASHGQTIFHRPDKAYTLQIGNGPELSITSGITSVVDFRTKDVALGGNGAPLIPVADHLLFNSLADSFLNIGGFANLSYKNGDEVLSYDICPTNIVINHLVKQIDLAYDKGGNFGRKGTVIPTLLSQLNNLEYYHTSGPKSLGWEWVNENLLPLLSDEIELKDLVRTLYEHFAMQIGQNIERNGAKSVLITGGGAKNGFLIERIKTHTTKEVIIPDESLIDLKEAIGFAFLGVLRYLGEVNVWASVTGAKSDSCSGQIIIP